MADYLTFKNIYELIQRSIKHFKGSQLTLVKELVNITYWELINADDLYPPFWLTDISDTLAAKAPRVINAITAANPGVITCTAAHGLVDGDVVSLHSIVGMTELNNRIGRVGTVGTTTIANDNFELMDLDDSGINTTNYTAYSSAGVVNHRGLTISTPSIERFLKGTVAFQGYNPMEEVTPSELHDLTRWWDASTSRPEKYLHRKKYIATGGETNLLIWFPGSDAAYDLRYWFEQRVSPLSAVTDVPMLPHRFHNAIAAGTIARLVEMSGFQIENAVIWPEIYKLHLEQLKSFNRKYYKDIEEATRVAPVYI